MTSDGERAAGGSNWPRGHLRACVLLLVAEEPSHGYDLLDRLEELGAAVIDAGTLYRTLRGMERDRLLVSSWETSRAGPARRIYRITPAGERQMAGLAEVLDDGRRSLERYLRRWTALVERQREGSDVTAPAEAAGSGR